MNVAIGWGPRFSGSIFPLIVIILTTLSNCYWAQGHMDDEREGTYRATSPG